MEWLSIMAKESDYFLWLDDKSKQGYKVKINNIQGCDLCQIKKEELRKNWKRMKVWSPTISVHIRMGQQSKNKTDFWITCWNYPGNWMGQYVMYFLLHYTVQSIRCIVFIALAKILKCNGASCHLAFMGNCLTISHKG